MSRNGKDQSARKSEESGSLELHNSSMPNAPRNPASPLPSRESEGDRGRGLPYDFRSMESRWKARWESEDPTPFDVSTASPESTQRKFYNLVEFPYPSAEGLHVGHAYTYAGADSLGRYMAMRGRQVLQPMGWDSFGIHTENYALKVGEHPASLTARTIANYKRQLKRLGADWSWEFELTTHDPRYYRWTQWIFVKLFQAGLAYQQEARVIWCPSCLSVLAFEQLEGDVCERCGSVPVYRKLRQWYLRITAFADELLEGLDGLDWPELSKNLQRDWIGRSNGARVVFGVVGAPDLSVEVFTTRVDTLFGVTFVVLDPDHAAIHAAWPELSSDTRKTIETMRDAQATVSTAGDRFARQSTSGVGVELGLRVAHPFTGEELPLYAADYVVSDYGTGAVMGVPAHDERDYVFATTWGLPIRVVVANNGEGEGDSTPFTGYGVLVESGPFTGMTSSEALTTISATLSEQGSGGPATQFRLHDWLVSRQRYWGSPIPIIHCASCGAVPVPEADLPVEQPNVKDWRPTGTPLSPLAAIDEFVNTTCPQCGGAAKRETDVFDTFVESSWYFLRYPSVNCNDVPWDPEVTRRLLPVDMYAGGREHATRHHLYARFVTRALHKLGFVPFAEPFAKLRLHGLLIKDGAKMSKSRGNVVNPDDYIDAVGADAFRAYLLFCGPWEKGGDFTDHGLQGIVRWNQRLWRLLTEEPPDGDGNADMAQVDHFVARVERSIERLKFNTAISALMEYSNWLSDERDTFSPTEWEHAARTIVLLMAPFEPFLAEELWERLGGGYSVHAQRWPGFDQVALTPEMVTVVVSVDSKVRAQLETKPDADEASVVAAALELPSVAKALGGETIDRVVYVPGRILNLVRARRR